MIPDDTTPEWNTASPVQPTWQQTVPVMGPDDETPFLLGFKCSNIPVGGSVAMNAAVPGNDDSLLIPSTIITVPNLVVMVQQQWPANFQGSVTLSYQQDDIPPPADATIMAMAVPVAGPPD